MKTTDSKSHTEQEIRQAITEGKTLFLLDSGNSGNDDILIAEFGESEVEVRAEVEAHHDMEDLPAAWSIRVMDPSDLDDLDDEEAGMDKIAEIVRRAQALNNAGDAGDAWSRHCGGISWREAGDRARALAQASSVEEVNAEMERRGIDLRVF